ncbi:hypothetical protein SESBI_34579 [Sesbania bispinosa]|nr:hypothetical protein SESBI_34579 [Sesbania bispinosa]
MAGVYDQVGSVFPGRQNWRLKVRVVRVWEMYPIDEPSRTFSVEMGERIQASIRKPMMKKFAGSIIEGEAYKMLFFGIVRNPGSYRATKHECKLIFHPKTKISRRESSIISLHGLNLFNSEDIMTTNGQSDYLVDVIGVLTAISTEKRSFRDGRMTRVMQLELTDQKGKVHCAMFGSYMDKVGDLLNGMGEVVLQNVLNTTKILCNPQISEVDEFRNGAAVHRIDILAPMGVIADDYNNSPPKDEFLKAHPRKTIKQLHETEEDGFFIVLASIVSVLNDGNWWYTACKCHRAVTMDGDRYKLRVEVYDGEDTAAFVLFDSDTEMLIGHNCAELLAIIKDKNGDELPSEFSDLAGKEVLFKVEKPADYAFKFDDSFRVKRVCDDICIIDLFKNEDSIATSDVDVITESVVFYASNESTTSDCAKGRGKGKKKTKGKDILI